jgi:hypothetical protein
MPQRKAIFHSLGLLKVTHLIILIHVTLNHFLDEFSLFLGTLSHRVQGLSMRITREPHGLDRVIVERETEADALVKSGLGLVCRVNVWVFLGAHVTVLVVDKGINDSVADGLKFSV